MSGVLPVGNLTSVLGHSVVVEKQGADTRNKVAPMGDDPSKLMFMKGLLLNTDLGFLLAHWL